MARRNSSRRNSRRRSQSRSRTQSRSRSQRGGTGNGWTSGSTYGMAVNGTGDAQFQRTFSTNSPYANRVGSEYVGAQGQWSHQPNTPSAQNLSLIQSAGRRKARKGGFLGPVLGQAIVPATILGLQQTYGPRAHTFKNKRYSRRR